MTCEYIFVCGNACGMGTFNVPVVYSVATCVDAWPSNNISPHSS